MTEFCLQKKRKSEILRPDYIGTQNDKKGFSSGWQG